MLPPEVADAGSRLLGELDLAITRPLAGLHVIGSAALDDWVAGTSDFDFVGVLEAPADLQTLAAIQAAHAKCPDADGIYVTVEQLRLAPARAGEALHAREGRVWISTEHVNPIWWHSLASASVALRGTEPAALEIWQDREALRDWCRANLHGYWRDWVQQSTDPASRASRALATDWGVAWCVLGVLRLRYSIDTGQITSKSGAGRYGLATMDDKWKPLISHALLLRHVAATTVTSPQTTERAARRDQVLDFMRLVIDGA